MIIVGVEGGLANQMFHYMFYLTLKQRREDVKMSTYIYQHFKPSTLHARYYLLEKIFALPKTDYASDKEVQRLGDFKLDIFSKARRRVLRLHKASVFRLHNLVTSNHVWQANDFYHRIKRCLRLKETAAPSDAEAQRQLIARNFEELVLADNLYLVGCFGDFDYVKNIEGKIREAFTFKLPLDERSQRVAQQMSGGGGALRFGTRQAR